MEAVCIKEDSLCTNTKEPCCLDLSTLCHAQPQDYSSIYVPEWFDMDKIHGMEKLALPEFFDDHAEEYIKYRNYMVQQYQAKPSCYVTVSSCKTRFPEADLVSLVRLHSFLELYNVINGQVRVVLQREYSLTILI